MSHQPPVPQGNQSPYPIQEPPHTHTQAVEPDTAPERSPADGQLANLFDDLPELSGRTIVAVGGAIAIGVVATIGALWLARRSPRKGKGKGKRARRNSRGKRAN